MLPISPPRRPRAPRCRPLWIAAIALIVAVAGSASSAHAQPSAVPTSRLVWDQDAGSLTEASGYTYRATWDGAALVDVAGVTCTGASSPFTCSAPFPALTPSAHTVQLAATNAAGSSPLSAAFNFVFVALPQAPRNLRIVAP